MGVGRGADVGVDGVHVRFMCEGGRGACEVYVWGWVGVQMWGWMGCM